MTALDCFIFAIALLVIMLFHQPIVLVLLIAFVVLLLLKLLTGTNVIARLNHKRTP